MRKKTYLLVWVNEYNFFYIHTRVGNETRWVEIYQS